MSLVYRGVLIWVTMALMPLSVSAFVPDGPHLVDLMVRAMGVPEKVRLDIVLEIPGDKEAETLGMVKEKLLFRIPDAFRSETEDGRRVRVGTAQGDFVLVLDEIIVREVSGPEDDFYLLLLVRDRSALLVLLENMGVDVHRTGLTRYGGRICYRLGSPSGSQILIDKESLYPLAMKRMHTRASGEMGEITFRYLEWQRRSGAAWPLRMEILEGEERLLQGMQVKSVQKDTLSDALFSTEILKKKYPSKDMPSVNRSEEDLLLEIEEHLERLRRRYE
ncbi:hypothetical protein OOT00_02720 [Desulfobotulus sp. H1]|uniref:DUF4384 domain-containing protein n=1 Tax=Desulfobotulus pelophilus TaxID=2823377 RepID=A0ABT3N605_9BACT|nr:hypothetical protein [Desulfobotulus pelophilus]MCW7752892.1 hypothetical protein [Desulfobotulus pelophilus]